MKANFKQPGRGVLVTLIILLVLLALAAIGYAVWGQGDGNSPVPKAVTKASQASKPASAVPTNPAGAPGNGVITTTFGKAPQPLRTAVMDNLRASDCFNSSGQLLAPGGGATVNIDTLPISYTNDGGAGFNACDNLSIFAYSGGEWRFVAASQTAFSCAQLEQYDFPAALLRAISGFPAGRPVYCVDANGNLAGY